VFVCVRVFKLPCFGSVSFVHSFIHSSIQSFSHSVRYDNYNLKLKRSLLPFIGKLSSTLFGTASEEDVQVVAAHVNSLTKSQSELLKGFQLQSEHMSSFMTLSQERITALESVLRQQHVALVDTLTEDRQMLIKTNRDLGFMLQFMFTKFSDYNILSQQATELFNGIQ